MMDARVHGSFSVAVLVLSAVYYRVRYGSKTDMAP